MKFSLSVLALVITLTGWGQNLKTFSSTMHPDSLCYLSIKNSKAYTAAAAGEVKSALDLCLYATKTDKQPVIEWYNLKPDNEKVPAALWGTQTRVVASSFDRDQFDKCKTAADLKRMTGYLSVNSFSHFAVVRNSPDYYQRCFLFEREDGKRGLIFVTAAGGSLFKVEVKAE